MTGAAIGLDNPAFVGRLKTHSRRSSYERRPVGSYARVITDVNVRQPKSPMAITGESKKTLTTAKLTSVLARQPATRRPAPHAPSKQPARSKVLKRSSVAPIKPTAPRPNNKGRAKGWAMTAVAVLLAVCGIAVGALQFTTNEKVKAQVETIVEQQADGSGSEDSGIASEKEPGDISSHKTAPTAPRILSIPTIGVQARVLGLGLTANNELKAPTNIHDAGWYEGSAAPGNAGAVLINGHVHGPSKPGVFSQLKKLSAGDTIQLERGDGKQYTYRVVTSKSYPVDAVDMGAAFNSVEPGKPGLNIITCDGSFDATGNYDKRLVVFAVQE